MHVRNRNARVGGPAALAFAVAVSLVAVPPQQSPVASETHQVQLAAAMISAAANTSALEIRPAESAWVTDSNLPEAQAIPMAAQTAEDDFWSSPLGLGLSLVNLLVLPLWFLAMPITLPLSMLGAAAAVPEGVSDTLAGLMFLTATAVGFLTGPLGFVNNITKMREIAESFPASYPAQSAAVSGRPGSAQTVSASTDVVALDSQAVPADETAATVTRARGRAALRHPSTTARVASAAEVQAPKVADNDDADVPVSDNGPQANPEQVRTSAVRSPSAKASAQRNSRR